MPGDGRRRRREDLRERSGAERRDQRRAVEARDRAFELPIPPVVRLPSPRRTATTCRGGRPLLSVGPRTSASAQRLVATQTLAVAGGAAREALEIERSLACRERADDAVCRAVERVALRATPSATSRMSSRENARGTSASACDEALHVPRMLQPDLRQVVARCAGEEAVELVRQPRRADERVPSAVRAADHVRVFGAPAVVALDDRLGERCQRDVRRVAVVEARLMIEAEQIAADEPASRFAWPS